MYEDYTPENNHIKLKGDYEIDKEFHKDPSMRIVPLAVKKYFVDGIPIKDTILNHNNIFDFCLRLKTNSKSTPYYTGIKDNEIINLKLDRTTRYYISKSGGSLYKDFGDNRKVGVNIGFVATLFNKYIEKPMSEYNINYQFYIAAAQKLINNIFDGQLNLFE